MPKWTTAQENAIYASDSNILVSAAAGSGKTAVLVQRVIEKITSIDIHPDIDELLVVTFTKAAAAEMKRRIGDSLREIIKKEPNNTNAIKQLSLLANAQISTIDSFLKNLVSEHFYMLDIQQDFTIIDDAKALLIENNAIEKVINELYENNDDRFKSLVELLSTTKDDKDFIKTVKDVNEFAQAQDFPNEWLDDLVENYNPNVDIRSSKYGKYLLSVLDSTLDEIENLIIKSIELLTESDDLYNALNEILVSDKQFFDNIRKCDEWDSLVDIINNFKFKDMTRKKSEFSAKDEIYSIRKIYQSIFKNDIKKIFTVKESEFKYDNEYLYNNVKLLVEIIKRYNDEMMVQKKELNAYSFNDILHFALQLLCYKDSDGAIVRTELAKEYESNFKEILVDEYQDTNSAQDTLFYTLSNGKNRFMVGDVKQSIYRFRLAMPQIFTKKKNDYDLYPTENSTNQTIILDQNFRSRKGICDYTNFVFSNIMTPEVGELDYNSNEYLNPGAKYNSISTPCAQIKIVTAPEDVDKDEYEARQVAQLILDKINSKELIKDGDNYREVRFSDFAVLFRAASKRLPIYADVFTQYGIPIIAYNKSNLFETNEVSILVSLLRVIDNPSQDIPLLATLMSVFYGYSADDIARAKVNSKARNLFGCISNDSTFSKFLNDLNKYRKYAASMDVESFLRQIISDTSYLSIITSMGNGEQRQLNVMKLISMAKSFDNGENVGITAFVRYIDSIMNSNFSVDGADANFSNQNAVNLTTIHKSKGLEYPICILIGAFHKYNFDNKSQIQLNSNYGIGLKVHVEEDLYRYNSLQFSCIKELNSTAEMSENLRVLYVAITRAKEQFITFYTDCEPEKHIKSISSKIYDSKLSPRDVKSVQCDADLILLTAMLHKDGAVLRDIADIDAITNNQFDFDMQIDFVNELNEFTQSEVEKVTYDEELLSQIDEKLSFEYERKSLANYSSKRTASALDERERGFKYFATSKPAFLNSSKLTGAEKGTAMHNFMQHCDYLSAKENLEYEIQRLLDLDLLSEIQANSLDKSSLNAFFKSSLVERMLKADNIYREIKVTTFVPVNELENTNFTDEVIIQGIADCVFEENGELVLVDYKTDRVENDEDLLKLYEKQIAFYCNAVQKTLQKPVKEALLYSFKLNKECIYK